jgi:hypothetical protein
VERQELRIGVIQARRGKQSSKLPYSNLFQMEKKGYLGFATHYNFNSKKYWLGSWRKQVFSGKRRDDYKNGEKSF